MSQGFEINNSNNITPVTIEINEGLISEVIMWLGIACDRRTTISNNIIVQRGRVDGDNNMRTIINTHNFTTYFINRYGYNHVIDEYISRVVGLVEEFNRFLDIEVENIQQTDENGVNNIWLNKEENVHDSSVNIHFKNSYKKIKIAVDNEPPITSENIKSFYYLSQRMNIANLYSMNSVIDLFTKILSDLDELGSIDTNDIEELELYKYIYTIIIDTLDDFKKISNSNNDNIIKINKAITVIDAIKKNNIFMVLLEDTELTILLNVWRRIHSVVNKESQSILIDLLTSELVNTYNPSNEDFVECANGRVGAILNSLVLYDSENIVTIKSVPILRIEMIQNRAPSVIKEAIEEYKKLSVNNEYECYRYQRNLDNYEKLQNYIIDNVKEKLTAEFKEFLPEQEFNSALEEIINEI
jgi:hypothetical protein